MHKFPSIEQFRNVIKIVKSRAQFTGLDSAGEPTYDHSLRAPTIRYTGTVKLHGTNAGIAYDVATKELSFQSRERVLTPESDNAGFMNYMLPYTETLTYLLADIALFRKANQHVVIFGEWCGGNIQKGVALSGLKKMFVVFALQVDGKFIRFNNEEVEHTAIDIFSIKRFPTFQLDIDFENPHLAQNALIQMTTQVENECPVGRYFDSIGTGEGIVWMPELLEAYDDVSRYWFKVKGEKHSVSKVKTLAEVDVEVINAINEFVERTVTEQRLEQGLDNLVREQLKPFELSSLGDFIRWVYNDIVKEERDTIAASNFDDAKKLGGPIANAARRWYINRYNSQR